MDHRQDRVPLIVFLELSGGEGERGEIEPGGGRSTFFCACTCLGGWQPHTFHNMLSRDLAIAKRRRNGRKGLVGGLKAKYEWCSLDKE